jgi:hypothetical protein
MPCVCGKDLQLGGLTELVTCATGCRSCMRHTTAPVVVCLVWMSACDTKGKTNPVQCASGSLCIQQHQVQCISKPSGRPWWRLTGHAAAAVPQLRL